MAQIGGIFLVALVAISTGGLAAADPEHPDWSDVSQIFTHRCVNCHAAQGAAKGLRLDSYQAAIAGGLEGPVLLPGDVAGSELIRRLRGESVPRMPFLSVPLPEDEIDMIVRWVESGLPDSPR